MISIFCVMRVKHPAISLAGIASKQNQNTQTLEKKEGNVVAYSNLKILK